MKFVILYLKINFFSFAYKTITNKKIFLNIIPAFIIKSLIRVIIFTLLSVKLFASEILVIGDSHMIGVLGLTIHRNLIQEGKNISTYAACGFNVNSWVKGALTSCGYQYRYNNDKLIDTNHYDVTSLKTIFYVLNPEIVIIELGDNMVRYSQFGESAANLENIKNLAAIDTNKIVSLLSQYNSKCFWITPTWGCYKKGSKTPLKLNKIIEGITSALQSRCTIIDSRKALDPQEIVSPDCLHVNSANSKKWGEYINKELDNE